MYNHQKGIVTRTSLGKNSLSSPRRNWKLGIPGTDLGLTWHGVRDNGIKNFSSLLVDVEEDQVREVG